MICWRPSEAETLDWAAVEVRPRVDSSANLCRFFCLFFYQINGHVNSFLSVTIIKKEITEKIQFVDWIEICITLNSVLKKQSPLSDDERKESFEIIIPEIEI